MSACSFLPDEDRRFLTRSRQVDCYDEEGNERDNFNNFSEDMNQSLPFQLYPEPSTYQSAQQVVASQEASNRCLRVITSPSPFINAYYKNQSLKILLDTGATVNLISERLAQ